MDALEVLAGRVSPHQLGEPGPSAEQIDRILAAGERAPDHGLLRPWRFILVQGGGRERFGDLLAASLKRREPSTPEDKLASERKKALRAPLIVIVAAAAREHPKIPVVEQIVAAGAAAQNVMLAAHGLGFGAFWRTGAPAYDGELKTALGLAPADTIVGFLYIGSIVAPGKLRPEPDAASRRRTL